MVSSLNPEPMIVRLCPPAKLPLAGLIPLSSKTYSNWASRFPEPTPGMETMMLKVPAVCAPRMHSMSVTVAERISQDKARLKI